MELGLSWECQKAVLVDLAPHEGFHSVTSRVSQLPATAADPGCRKEFHQGQRHLLTAEGRGEGKGGVLC